MNWIPQARLLRRRSSATSGGVRLRSVAALTGLPVPGRASLSMPARRRKPIRDRAGNLAGWTAGPAMRGALSVTRMLTWFETHDSAGHAVTGTGPPSQPFFLRAAQPPTTIRGAPARTGAASPLSELDSVSENRCDDGAAFSLATLMATFLARTGVPLSLPPCPASGQRRGTLYRESR